MKVDQILKVAGDRYEHWRQQVMVLRDQFAEIDTLGGQILQQLPNDWKFHDVSYGQCKTFMGVSGYGYNFGLRLIGPESKKIEVTCGCVFGKAGNGIGDERSIDGEVKLNYKARPYQFLDFNTLIANQDRSLTSAKCIEQGSQVLIKSLDANPVYFSAYSGSKTNTGLGAKFNIDFLKEMPLATIFKRAFVAITNADLEEFKSTIPADNLIR